MLKRIETLLKAFLAFLGNLVNPIGTRFAAGVQTWWNLIIIGGLKVSLPILGAAAPLLQPIADEFSKVIRTTGGPLRALLFAPFGFLAKEAVELTQAPLIAAGESTPDNAIDRAAAAFAGAFANGASSAAVAALFEAVFPEQLNVLNGLAPLLGKMAGFDEVAGEIMRPLYSNAFGKSLDYHFRSVFKAELPSEQNAVAWHARRLLTDAQLRRIFAFSGLKDEYEAPFIESAFRPLSPFILGRLADDTGFDETKTRDALADAGFSATGIELAIEGFHKSSVKSHRASAVSAAVSNFETGIAGEAELNVALADLGLTEEARDLVLEQALRKRLNTLTLDYKRAWDNRLEAGVIGMDEYRLVIAGLGFVEPMATALIGIEQAKLDAQIAKEERAEIKSEIRKAQAVATTAAMTLFKKGDIDAVELTGVLLVIGLDPILVAADVALAEARGVTRPKAAKPKTTIPPPTK